MVFGLVLVALVFRGRKILTHLERASKAYSVLRDSLFCRTWDLEVGISSGKRVHTVMDKV
jgi:hypothetical protein